MSIFSGRYQSPRKTDGTVNSAGKLYFYETGTSTLKSVYQDENLSTEHTNPVILDSNGSALVFLGSGSYDYRVDDSADVAVVPSQGPITANADINNITVTPNLIVNGDFTGIDTASDRPDSWNVVSGNISMTSDASGWSGATTMDMTSNTGETTEVSSTVVTISENREYLFLIECECSGDNYQLSFGISETSDTNIWNLDSIDLNDRVYARTFFSGTTEITNGRVWITLTSTSGLATASIGSIKMIDITGQARVPSVNNLTIINNATNPNSQIDIAADHIDLVSNNDYPVRFRNVSITGDITTDLLTGSEANSTWYKVYLTYHLGVISVRFVEDSSSLVSDSAIYQRLIGYVFNDSSGNFRRFEQFDNWVSHQSAVTVFTQTDVDTTWTTVDLDLPVDVRVADLIFYSYGSGAPAAAFLQYRNDSSFATNITASRDNTIALASNRVVTDSSGEIEIRHSGAGLQQALVSLSGWLVPAL
jgi:hypothetical protein